jgi:hypothetical protein
VIGFCLRTIGQPTGNRLLSSRERHELSFRVAGPDAQTIYERMTAKLDDTEFAIPRQIVADVVVYGQPTHEPDGSISFAIEALTVQE